MLRMAIVGDIHGHWTDVDARLLDARGYDAIVVLGDLAGLRWEPTLTVARHLAALTTRTIFVPGNHDATHVAQLLAEISGRPHLGDPLVGVQQRRLEELVGCMQPCELGAYSLHVVGEVSVIAGRPHSMGGPTLAFPAHLAASWQVHSLEDSTRKLCELVDRAPTDDLVFVAHNGPTGLGDGASDLWGSDFRAQGGDWGDPDLREAVDYAQSRGRRVHAVCAGHMHRTVRGGGIRPPSQRRSGVLYVNAAQVPRIDRGVHHHVQLTIDDGKVRASDVWEVA